jgi:hypothetical protein
MKKYATIDMNSGFVFWAGEADSPEQACTMSDLEAGAQHSPSWKEIRVSNRHAATYAVYEIPADLEVTDGQDEDQIEAVEQNALAGYYQRIEEA